jgi:hypothetical protein
MAFQERFEPKALDEVVDEGKRSQSLSSKSESLSSRDAGLLALHSGDNIIASIQTLQYPEPLMTAKKEAAIRNAQERIARIQESIGDIEHLSSGTLLKRMKRCGNPRCACARDPDALHGPYYEWSYMNQGRLRHRTLSPEQAKLMRRAIANHRKVKRLLQLWETYTRRLIELTVPGRR